MPSISLSVFWVLSEDDSGNYRTKLSSSTQNLHTERSVLTSEDRSYQASKVIVPRIPEQLHPRLTLRHHEREQTDHWENAATLFIYL